MAGRRNSGWNPTRRNRNIGTEASGYKEDSRFTIPARWGNWTRYYEDLDRPVTTSRHVHGLDLKFVVEPTARGCTHVCTPDDIAGLLSLLPSTCVKGPRPLQGVVMRQPTRKQGTLAGVWGRMVYGAKVGPIDGPTVFLEACPPFHSYRWGRKVSLEGQAESERMQRILPGPSKDGRFQRFELGFANLRRWILYHTLVHEIGHWMDYRSKVLEPGWAPDGDLDDLFDRYFQRPRSEREAFAHRFSDEWRDELIHRGEVPFAHRFNTEELRAEGLDPAWFAPPSPEDSQAGPAIAPMFAERREPMFKRPRR